MIETSILTLLACPVCHGTLRQPNPDTLICDACGRRYPVDNDVPVLIIDVATKDDSVR